MQNQLGTHSGPTVKMGPPTQNTKAPSLALEMKHREC